MKSSRQGYFGLASSLMWQLRSHFRRSKHQGFTDVPPMRSSAFEFQQAPTEAWLAAFIIPAMRGGCDESFP